MAGGFFFLIICVNVVVVGINEYEMSITSQWNCLHSLMKFHRLACKIIVKNFH